MSYTIAPAVKAALAEANRLWPDRSRASDGTIGDPAHSARLSDHNPDERGIVHAFDLTHDPSHGVDCHRLAEQLRDRVLDGVERRVKYVIWNTRIFNPSVSGHWRTYGGTNPHTKHMHVSIRSGGAVENDVTPWWWQTEEGDDMTPEQAKLLAEIATEVKAIRAELDTGAAEVPSVGALVVETNARTKRFGLDFGRIKSALGISDQ